MLEARPDRQMGPGLLEPRDHFLLGLLLLAMTEGFFGLGRRLCGRISCEASSSKTSDALNGCVPCFVVFLCSLGLFGIALFVSHSDLSPPLQRIYANAVPAEERCSVAGGFFSFGRAAYTEHPIKIGAANPLKSLRLRLLKGAERLRRLFIGGNICCQDQRIVGAQQGHLTHQ